MEIAWRWRAVIEANRREHAETGQLKAPQNASEYAVRQAASKTLDQRYPNGFIIVGHINVTPAR